MKKTFKIDDRAVWTNTFSRVMKQQFDKVSKLTTNDDYVSIGEKLLTSIGSETFSYDTLKLLDSMSVDIPELYRFGNHYSTKEIDFAELLAKTLELDSYDFVDKDTLVLGDVKHKELDFDRSEEATFNIVDGNVLVISLYNFAIIAKEDSDMWKTFSKYDIIVERKNDE